MRAAIWDVDGTLANSYNLGFITTNEIMKRNGYNEVGPDEYREGSIFKTPARFHWHITGNDSPPSEEAVRLGDEFYQLYITMVTEETTGFFPGIKEILRTLQDSGIKQGLLSNEGGDYVRAVVRVNEVESFFEVQFGVDNVPAPKPSAEGLLQCCHEMDISPSECIYIGDSPSDGQAASCAGMKSIGVTWGANSTEKIVPFFDNIVENVSQLHECILDEVSKEGIKSELA